MAAASSSGRREPRSERRRGRRLLQQRWFTSYYEDETLAYHARPCQFVTLSRFSYALYTAIRLTSVYIPPPSCLLFLLPHRIFDSPPPLFRSYTVLCSPLLHPSGFLSIYIYMYKSNVKVHLPPSISLHFPTSAFPARPSSS